MTIWICLADAQKSDISQDLLLSLPFGEGELLRLQRIGNPNARAQSFAALLALRTLLERRGIPPRPIAREPEGKPYFVGETELYFNLTHSHTLAAAALASCPVGIDLEFLRPERDVKRIAARFFTDIEREAWSRLPTAERFFALWTKKEASAKLCGKGLLQAERKKSAYIRTHRLSTSSGVAFLSIASTAPMEHVEWVLPQKDLMIELYET